MAGALSMRNRYFGFAFGEKPREISAINTIKKVSDDKMSQYQSYRNLMVVRGHGNVEDYRDGDKILTMEDINLDLINQNENTFYWNFFDDLYINAEVAKWAGDRINFDNLRFNERNADCLEFVYPELTARARLYGGKLLANVLRNYELKYYLDVDKLACQLIGATPEFIEEFGVTEEMTRPAVIDTGIDNIEAVRVATSRNLEIIAEFLKVRFSKDSYFLVKECMEDGNTITKLIQHVDVVMENGIVSIYGDRELKNSIVPGDCVNIETRKNTYVIKSATDGSLAHFLKFTKWE